MFAVHGSEQFKVTSFIKRECYVSEQGSKLAMYFGLHRSFSAAATFPSRSTAIPSICSQQSHLRLLGTGQNISANRKLPLLPAALSLTIGAWQYNLEYCMMIKRRGITYHAR
jgi:hypothetical protein